MTRFGGQATKGLKISTKNCNSGNLSKGPSWPSWTWGWGSFFQRPWAKIHMIKLNPYLGSGKWFDQEGSALMNGLVHCERAEEKWSHPGYTFERGFYHQPKVESERDDPKPLSLMILRITESRTSSRSHMEHILCLQWQGKMFTCVEDGAKARQNESLSFEMKLIHSHSPFNKYFLSTYSLPCTMIGNRESNNKQNRHSPCPLVQR